MRVVLGPMEGVLDHLMREILTEINDYDLCVTEFIRVVDQLLPKHVFYRLCPELSQGSKTRAGVPVNVQLLGQHPQWMAENAYQAAELGAHGIDINFGCPAKTVNRHKGGAALLAYPETVYQIVKSCRDAVPASIPVSAKIRLGLENPTDCFDIVDAIEQAGANELTVHARTKVGGYKASEIKWEYIQQIRQKSSIPLIANGEIWNHDDAQRCKQVTGVADVMICRGAFSTPNLGNVVKHNHMPMPWHEVLELLLAYSRYEIQGDRNKYYSSRIKQWFCFLKNAYPQADPLFRKIRTLTQIEPMTEKIQAEMNLAANAQN